MPLIAFSCQVMDQRKNVEHELMTLPQDGENTESILEIFSQQLIKSYEVGSIWGLPLFESCPVFHKTPQ